MEKMISDRFGYAIAFLLPGFIGVWVISSYVPAFNAWLMKTCDVQQTIGSIVYVLLASLSVGIIISAIRWVLFDRMIFRRTSNKIAGLDYSKLSSNLEAYKSIIEGHYQFYQFYSNMLIAILFLAILQIEYLKTNIFASIGISLLSLILIWAANGCFNNCYKKLKVLLK